MSVRAFMAQTTGGLKAADAEGWAVRSVVHDLRAMPPLAWPIGDDGEDAVRATLAHGRFRANDLDVEVERVYEGLATLRDRFGLDVTTVVADLDRLVAQAKERGAGQGAITQPASKR
jgi:hypothetical protein